MEPSTLQLYPGQLSYNMLLKNADGEVMINFHHRVEMPLLSCHGSAFLELVREGARYTILELLQQRVAEGADQGSARNDLKGITATVDRRATLRLLRQKGPRKPRTKNA